LALEKKREFLDMSQGKVKELAQQIFDSTEPKSKDIPLNSCLPQTVAHFEQLAKIYFDRSDNADNSPTF
jgi:hypothetical protein